MRINSIIIFTTEPFPYGMAATNRIISYAKGFIFHGMDVEVVCLRRSEKAKNKIVNTDIKGIYQGVNFKYLSKSTIKSRFFILRGIHILFSYSSLFFYSLKKINSKTASIYYSSNTTPLLVLWVVNKLKKGVILKEESEHPETRRYKMYFSWILYKTIHYRLFHGFLLMTKNLISYFDSRFDTPILHVPMTVELDRFAYKNKKSISKNNILFTGVLNDKKDGVDVLLEAFAKIVRSDDSYQLYLYGSALSKKDMNRYFELVNELKINHLVHFKGRVSREIITESLLNAKILVLPRPDSLQAQNGFPTKLGEYLATANPTLVTGVGEIPDRQAELPGHRPGGVARHGTG